jgi:hypothetical protein
MTRFLRCFVLLLWLLTACQTSLTQPLPTLVSLEAIATQTAIANIPTATNTRRAPPLPPTFTPTIPPTVEATTTPVPPTPTPPGFSATGRLFYIYNQDAIAVINGDGTAGKILVSFGVGQPITDLTVSPDRQLLAYVAPGSGSAREVYISSLDGTYTQQVSCLGYNDVRYVTWTPDSQTLAFFAAGLPGQPGDLYMASYIGANECPTGNNQRVIVPFQSPDIRGLTFNQAGSILFYAGGGKELFAWDLSTGQRAIMAYSGGYEGNFAPAHSPTTNQLAFLNGGQYDGQYLMGATNIIDKTETMPESPSSSRASLQAAWRLYWSLDGALLLAAGKDTLVYADFTTNQIKQVVTDIPLSFPDAAIRPDKQAVAFTALDPKTGIPQIFGYDFQTTLTHPITAHPEGSITNIAWLEGNP